MTADAYLPVWVYDMPCNYVFQPDGAARERIAHAIKLGVVRVVAGPEKCHVMIDVRRPYYRPVTTQVYDERVP